MAITGHKSLQEVERYSRKALGNGEGYQMARKGMATPRGFEPLTNSLEGCCSIQLSYGAMLAKCSRFRCTSRSLPHDRA